MSYKSERLRSLYLKEITSIIQNEVKDPKLGFVTVSDIALSADNSLAKVYVTFLGKDERNEAGLKVLDRAKGYIRSELAKRLKVYKVPELRFMIDDSLKRAERIEAIIDKINNDK